MSSWRGTQRDYSHLSTVFEKYQFDSQHLNGTIFIERLTDLCGPTEHVFGSWIDICANNNEKQTVDLKWHVDLYTVLLCLKELKRYTV